MINLYNLIKTKPLQINDNLPVEELTHNRNADVLLNQRMQPVLHPFTVSKKNKTKKMYM